MSCFSQAIDISEKKNSNSVSFHEILEAEENIWMRNCTCCCWIFLNAIFTAVIIIIWKVLTCSLKKTDCSDSNIILKKELNCSFFCQINFFYVEIEVKECCIYNDLFLNRLKINKSFWFMISETDETSVDN